MFKNKKIILMILFFLHLISQQALIAYDSSWIDKTEKLFKGFEFDFKLNQESVDNILSDLKTYESTDIKDCIRFFIGNELNDLEPSEKINLKNILYKGLNGGVFRVFIRNNDNQSHETIIIKLFDEQRPFLREVSTLSQINKLDLKEFKIANIYGGAICKVNESLVYMLAEEDLGEKTFKDILSKYMEENSTAEAEILLKPLMKKLASGLSEFHYKNVENTCSPLNPNIKNALLYEINHFYDLACNHELPLDLEELKNISTYLINHVCNKNISCGRMHFDLHFNNIIITKEQKIGLIDFAGSFFSLGRDDNAIGMPNFDITYFIDFHIALHDFRIDYLQQNKLKWVNNSVITNSLDFFCGQYMELRKLYIKELVIETPEERIFYRMIQGILLFVYKYKSEAITHPLLHQKTSSLLFYCINHLQIVTDDFNAILAS